MRPVSDAFLAAVAAGYDVVFRADQLLQGNVETENLPVTGGQVTLDRRRLIRGAATIDVPGQAWVPIAFDDPLAPFGQEIHVRAGIAHRDGLGDEYVDLGVYRVDEPRSGDGPEGLVTIVGGGDRSSAVTDAGFVGPWNIAAGTNVATAVRALIEDVLPWAPFSFAPTAFVTPALTWAETDDRWARAVQLAASIGMELFFDGAGICVMRAEPTLLDDPVATIRDGVGGTMIAADRVWSRIARPNAVIATGNNSGGDPYRGEAYDLDDASPTKWEDPPGRYGQVVEHISGPYTSDEMATDAATARLQSKLGVVQSLECDAVPNFALEPSDVVEAERTRLGVDETDVLDALTFTLSATGRMRAVMRARQVLVSS